MVVFDRHEVAGLDPAHPRIVRVKLEELMRPALHDVGAPDVVVVASCGALLNSRIR